MWAVFVMDIHCSDGFDEYTNLPLSAMRIRLPCDEEAFTTGAEYDSGRLELPYVGRDRALVLPAVHLRTAKCPLAQYVTIFAIKGQILRLVFKPACSV